VDKDLPRGEWMSFFEELNRLKAMDIILEGGEPFYREDLKEIIEGIVRNRMRFSVLTNGTLITPEMASFLSSTGRVNHVQVSVDGAESAAHDFSRGDGSFLKAVAGIANLKAGRVPVTVRVTIHKENVRELEGIAKLLLEDIGIPGFSTNAASYMGLCRQNAARLQLDVEDRSFAMEELLRLNKKDIVGRIPIGTRLVGIYLNSFTYESVKNLTLLINMGIPVSLTK